jgi:hypothetical protein
MLRMFNSRTATGVCALCVAGVLFFLFSGCGKSVKKEGRDNNSLEKIVLEYWNNRLVSRNYQASYAREMDKDSVPFETYKDLVSRNERFQFSDVKADIEKIEAQKASVLVSVKAIIPALRVPLDRTFKDQWIYSDSGLWQHRFSKSQP